MKFIEKNLEDIVFESNRLELKKRGLQIDGKLLRQVRIGNYGVADLISIKRPRPSICEEPMLEITIYELKQDIININTLLQASRYVKGINRWFEESKYYDYNNISVKIVMIGSRIDTNSDFIYLKDICYNKNFENLIDIYSYEYKIDGIYFKNCPIYTLINEGF